MDRALLINASVELITKEERDDERERNQQQKIDQSLTVLNKIDNFRPFFFFASVTTLHLA